MRVWKNGIKVWKWYGMGMEFYFTPSVGALYKSAENVAKYIKTRTELKAHILNDTQFPVTMKTGAKSK
jgi:hypothetical protein